MRWVGVGTGSSMASSLLRAEALKGSERDKPSGTGT